MITRAASPALWARVDGLCRRLGTQPVTHIVGGIDDNFFVTEHPVHLTGHELTGRTLFVSLSLLKRLDKGEADAVLAHEMAHFSGGDTEYSKRTSPLLSRFRTYLGALHEAACRGRSSTSCCCTGRSCSSPSARAAGPARFAPIGWPPRRRRRCPWPARSAGWRRIRRTGPASRPASSTATAGTTSLDIGSRVAAGFMEYARGPHLASDLSAQSFPHPFDSHPPLGARLSALGVNLGNTGVANAVTAAPAETWFSEITRRGPDRGVAVGRLRVALPGGVRDEPGLPLPAIDRRGARPRRAVLPAGPTGGEVRRAVVGHRLRATPLRRVAGCGVVVGGQGHQGGRPDLPRQGADVPGASPRRVAPRSATSRCRRWRTATMPCCRWLAATTTAT